MSGELDEPSVSEIPHIINGWWSIRKTLCCVKDWISVPDIIVSSQKQEVLHILSSWAIFCLKQHGNRKAHNGHVWFYFALPSLEPRFTD